MVSTVATPPVTGLKKDKNTDDDLDINSNQNNNTNADSNGSEYSNYNSGNEENEEDFESTSADCITITAAELELKTLDEKMTIARKLFLSSLGNIVGPNSKCFSEEKRTEYVDKLFNCALNNCRLPNNLKGYVLGTTSEFWESMDLWAEQGASSERLELWTNKSTSSSSLNRGIFRRVIPVEQFFDIIYENHRHPETGAYLGQKRVFEKLKDCYACLPRDAVDRYISAWRKVFQLNRSMGTTLSIPSTNYKSVSNPTAAHGTSLSVMTTSSHFSFNGISMVPRFTAADALNLSRTGTRLEDVPLNPLRSMSDSPRPASSKLLPSSKVTSLKVKRDGEDHEEGSEPKKMKLDNGSATESSIHIAENEHSAKPTSDMEMACNLTLRKFVDELLDRTVTFCNQPKERVNRMEDLLQTLFPDLDPMRLRSKIRSYLKACRRNSKKHGGEVQMKGTPSHLTSDAAKKISADFYEQSREQLEEMKLLPDESSNPSSECNHPHHPTGSSQGASSTSPLSRSLHGVVKTLSKPPSDALNLSVDPMEWALGTLLGQTPESTDLVHGLLSLPPLIAGKNTAFNNKSIVDAVQKNPTKARQFMETLRRTATYLVYSATQLETILNSTSNKNGSISIETNRTSNGQRTVDDKMEDDDDDDDMNDDGEDNDDEDEETALMFGL